MREIASPIGNPDRKWVRVDTYHLSINTSGPECRLSSTKIKDKSWIGKTYAYFIDDPNGKLDNDKIVVCYVFRLFGRFPVLQHWGFLWEVGTGKEQQAVCLGGKWFLVEKDDQLEIDAKGQTSPFKEITITLRGANEVKSETFKRGHS